MLLRSASFGNEQMTPHRLRLSFCREEKALHRQYAGRAPYQVSDATPGVMSVVGQKLRRTQYEHIISALPSNSDIARRSRHVSKVPGADSTQFWITIRAAW